MLITPAQIATLTKLMHFSNAQAADRLSGLIDHTVRLAPPKLRLMDRGQAALALSSDVPGWTMSIKVGFRGVLVGDAYLLLDERSATSLVDRMAAQFPGEDPGISLEEILAEVANILLNGYVGTLSNLIGTDLRYDVPEFKKRVTSDALRLTDDVDPDATIMTISTTLQIDDVAYEASLTLFIGFSSIAALATATENLMREVGLST